MNTTADYHVADLQGHDPRVFCAGGRSDLRSGQKHWRPIRGHGQSGSRNHAPFDGMLATGIFTHDDIDMDFGAERVNFFSTDHCEGKVVYWPHQVLAVVPGQWNRVISTCR